MFFKQSKIELQLQPTNNTCTSACLAMLCKMDVLDVVSEFHELWMNNKVNPAQFLTKHQVQHKTLNTYELKADFGNVYLLTVPSLNIEGGLHHIIMDLRDEENDEVRIFDPNRGKPGKRFYQGWDKPHENKLAVKLCSWVIDLVIIYDIPEREVKKCV